MKNLVCSFWFNRFQVLKQSENYYFHDCLISSCRVLPIALFEMFDTQRKRDIAFFVKGFMQPCLALSPLLVKEKPESESDLMFWQFPCRTEAVAFERHQRLKETLFIDNEIHIYLALPWTTFIDKERVDKAALNPKELLIPRTRLSGYRYALMELGVKLRVHTVCQHIYWHKLIPIWEKLGVTNLWLSHKTTTESNLSFNLHPWPLYAVNIEDTHRNVGLVFGKDPAKKRYLASFIGAHMEHYLSDVRLQLQQFINEPNFLIHITQKWHFEDIVYQHQVNHMPLSNTYQIDHEVENYNHVLSESVFSLCPSGAGANTLRLWESLAVGSIPVLMGVMPELPYGGTLEPIDWDRIIIRINNEQIPNLPTLLRNISHEERCKRQQLAMQAYAKVREQRCFC